MDFNARHSGRRETPIRNPEMDYGFVAPSLACSFGGRPRMTNAYRLFSTQQAGLRAMHLACASPAFLPVSLQVLRPDRQETSK